MARRLIQGRWRCRLSKEGRETFALRPADRLGWAHHCRNYTRVQWDGMDAILTYCPSFIEAVPEESEIIDLPPWPWIESGVATA